MRRPLAALLALCLAGPAAALEVDPLYRFQLLGGQYFFQGQRSALTGNVSGLVAPALRFNEEWAVLPTVSSSYQGTKQVLDLVGSGTLFQEQMDHRVGAKLIHSPGGGDWRLKAATGYRAQLLKETKDEDWTEGLFDYHTLNAGVEAEYVWRDPFSIRLGYDFALTAFPNYSSLESQLAQDFQGQPLARELVGDRILDNRSQIVSAAFSLPLGRFAVEAGALFMDQRYPKQKLVNREGLLEAGTRVDRVSGFDAALRLASEAGDVRVLGSLSAGFRRTDSNQSSYDARNTRFFDGFYDNWQVSAGPSARLLFGEDPRPVSLGLGTLWTHRRYPNRRAQEASGGYTGEALSQHSWMVNATLSYPMAKFFSLIFNVQHGRSVSNQAYEQAYSYNYSVTNYLFGFSYDY